MTGLDVESLSPAKATRCAAISKGAKVGFLIEPIDVWKQVETGDALDFSNGGHASLQVDTSVSPDVSFLIMGKKKTEGGDRAVWTLISDYLEEG